MFTRMVTFRMLGRTESRSSIPTWSESVYPACPGPVGSLSALRQSSISRRPSPFSSTAYKMLFPQLLCFDNDPFSWGVYPPQRGNHELHNHELQLHRCNASSYHQERLRPLPASFRQWQTLPQLRL